MDDLSEVRAFSFTELRVEQCIRLVAAGKVKTNSHGRRYSRDSSHVVHLPASAKGAAIVFPTLDGMAKHNTQPVLPYHFR
jgi:hypothetical protein